VDEVGMRLIDDYLHGEEPWVRRSAARALGRMRYKPAAPVLIATLYFTVRREVLVPAEDGFSVGVLPGIRTTGGERIMIRPCAFQTWEVRVIDDTAFNDAARAALGELAGASFDFDRPAWETWWFENEKKLDDWMRPAETATK
jgi:hypothetical protein